jgi:protease-4
LRPRCVGVVAVRGTIHSGESRAAPFSGPTAGDRTVCAALEAARKNKRVRAVVLYVDSRGGSSLASDLMWRAVERLRAEKPVVACFGNYAASGGYYVATGCDRIFASPGTITGSIGVLAGKLDLSGLWSRLGVKVEVLRRGARGDLYSTHRSLDDAERARLEADISAVYDDFVSRVAEGRKLSHEAVHDVAQGRVWTGARALEHKLVDALGTFDDALAHARERAGFRAGATPPVVLFSGPSRGPLAFLTRGALAETPIPATDLARVLGLDLPSLEELSLLAEARELLWWPHEIDAS